MAVTVNILPPVTTDGRRVLGVSVTDKLEVEDYEQLEPALERLISEQGEIDLLVQLDNFAGWSAGALWEDTKLGVRHFSDVRRMAIVGESLWQKGMALFVKPFTSATVRYFDVAETGEAMAWLRR